jgi:predicted TIM-barrel fold metal-dependent hydrolase
MDRVERIFSSYGSAHLDRNAARAIVEQVWVSTSGFSSTPAFLAAFMTFGADRILFSVDYPFCQHRSKAIVRLCQTDGSRCGCHEARRVMFSAGPP